MHKLGNSISPYVNDTRVSNIKRNSNAFNPIYVEECLTVTKYKVLFSNVSFYRICQ